MANDNEIWDEFKWEDFMKEQDKKVDHYMELFYRYRDDPNRDQIIAREMGWDWLFQETQEDEDRPFLLNDEEIEEGEDWKIIAGVEDGEAFDLGKYETLPVYQISH